MCTLHILRTLERDLSLTQTIASWSYEITSFTAYEGPLTHTLYTLTHWPHCSSERHGIGYTTAMRNPITESETITPHRPSEIAPQWAVPRVSIVMSP